MITGKVCKKQPELAGKRTNGGRCCECSKEHNKKHRIANEDALKERGKNYYLNNADAVKSRQKKYYADNADLIKARHKEYCATNTGYVKSWHKEWHLKSKYGITLDSLKLMEIEQNHRCKICHDITEGLVVDHDHQTGMVRGLLCNRCNVALGGFRDNLDILKSAVEYLLKTELLRGEK